MFCSGARLMETRTRLGGVWKLCRVISRRLVSEDDGTTGSAAYDLSIGDTAREDTPPTVPTRDCLDP